MSWHIVRAFTGHPFEIECALRSVGLNAYCPRYTIKRRHPYSRHVTIDVVKPLFPGYLFADKPFDARLINTSRIKTKLMSRDGRYLTVTEQEMVRVREAEKRAGTDWHPTVDEIIRTFAEIVKSVGPRKFTRLSDLQRSKRVAA